MRLNKLVGAAVVSLALPFSANADNIDTVDLTGVLGGAGDVVSGVQFGDVDGGALVIQSLTGGTLNVGDTFTESGELEITNWNSSPLPGGEIASGLGSAYEMFFTFTNLTGSITAINLDGSFDYTFDPFAGDIALVVDTVVDGTTTLGATTLGTLELAAGDGNFGSTGIALGNDGDNNLILQFTSFLAGVFFDENGFDMSGGIPSETFVALGNLDNTIAQISPILNGNNELIGQELVVSTNGIVTFNVPEPAPLALIGLGMLGFGISRARKAKQG